MKISTIRNAIGRKSRSQVIGPLRPSTCRSRGIVALRVWTGRACLRSFYLSSPPGLSAPGDGERSETRRVAQEGREETRRVASFPTIKTNPRHDDMISPFLPSLHVPRSFLSLPFHSISWCSITTATAPLEQHPKLEVDPWEKNSCRATGSRGSFTCEN